MKSGPNSNRPDKSGPARTPGHAGKPGRSGKRGGPEKRGLGTSSASDASGNMDGTADASGAGGRPESRVGKGKGKGGRFGIPGASRRADGSTSCGSASRDGASWDGTAREHSSRDSASHGGSSHGGSSGRQAPRPRPSKDRAASPSSGSSAAPLKDEPFLYERTDTYFVQLADGLAEWAVPELKALGASKVKAVYRGAEIRAEARALYRIIHEARLAGRVLAPLVVFDCHSPKYLKRVAGSLDWSRLLTPKHTFAVQATVANSHMRHSRYAALCLKDAIADQFRDRCGRRPDVSVEDPDLGLYLHIQGNRATIHIDLSGGSLHKRGYRRATVAAPMQETLAATMLAEADWSGETPLVDPMCGSGTLLCEAWMRAARIPAGLLRQRVGLERLPDFDTRLWEAVRGEAHARIGQPAAGVVSGGDIAREAVRAAKHNLAALPGGESVAIRRRPFAEHPGVQGGVVVCNPPYGVRLGGQEDAEGLMKAFGDWLKQRCTGSRAYLYVGDRALLKHLGLKVAFRKPLQSGGLDGRLVRVDCY